MCITPFTFALTGYVPAARTRELLRSILDYVNHRDSDSVAS